MSAVYSGEVIQGQAPMAKNGINGQPLYWLGILINGNIICRECWTVETAIGGEQQNGDKFEIIHSDNVSFVDVCRHCGNRLDGR